jgi:predicted DCC family thiol-disulfide oxidoreductase YuxK
MNESWTGGQYSLYRLLLGGFLAVHFGLLLPHGAEVFGAGGVVASASLSPLMGVLPNPLAFTDSPLAVQALLTMGLACGLAVAVGWFDRVAAVLAALVLAWLFQRNPLIANPSLPLLGWLLVLHAFVPPGPYGSVAALRHGGADAAWRFPRHLFVAAWVVLALAYSHSGYTKLFSPAWTDGETIRLVLENPLARDHVLREFALSWPPLYLKCLTWTVLLVELLFAPLALIRRARPAIWTIMLGAQLGFLCFLNFADLTFPMLLAHMLTFDPAWVGRPAPRVQPLLLFDGHCAFCNANVRFAMKEDPRRLIRFAPLSSEEASQALKDVRRDWTGDSIVLIDERGHSVKSRAVAGVLEHLGGLWFLLGRALRAVPRPIADAGYDFIGRVRYRLGGKLEYCPLAAAPMSSRGSAGIPD